MNQDRRKGKGTMRIIVNLSVVIHVMENFFNFMVLLLISPQAMLLADIRIELYSTDVPPLS